MIPGESYRGINIGDHFDDVIEKLGAPASKYPTKDNYDPWVDDTFYWAYPDKGLEIEFLWGGAVHAIHASLNLELEHINYAIRILDAPDDSGKYRTGRYTKRWFYWDKGIQVTTNSKGVIESICICEPST